MTPNGLMVLESNTILTVNNVKKNLLKYNST